MSHYPQIRLTRSEVDATAIAAKSGDRQAFERLITATIGLYYHLARWVPSDDRDDVVHASVIYTYHILELFDPAKGYYMTYMGQSIAIYQRRYYASIRHPVTVASERVKVQAEWAFDRNGAPVDLSTVAEATDSDLERELDMRRGMARLRAQLERLPQRSQDSVLLTSAEFKVRYGLSRERYRQIRDLTLDRLKRRM